MGSLKSPNAHELAMHEKGKSKMKPNQQYKGKGKARDPEPRNGWNPKPRDDSSSSKGKKGKKGNLKCPYCNRGYHPESYCMQKTIDMMAKTLQQNNLSHHIL